MPEPALVDLRILQGTDWTKPFRVKLDDGTLLDTSLYTARMQIRGKIEDAAPVLDLTTANGLLAIGYDPPKRANSTAYGVGQQIVPAALNGYVYECTVAGTSGGSPPAYSTTIGATFSDGTVTWRVESADDVVSNLRIVLEPGDTAPLDSWGNGYWDLELIDDFGHVLRIMEGRCVLSREVTR